MQPPRTRRLLFVVTEDWYFLSHRLPLAQAALEAGYEVLLAARVGSHKAEIEAAGVRVVPLQSMRRSSLNPFHEAAALLELYSIYRREKPDLVHQVALKPVLYGALAARLAGVPAQVNALGGLGFAFSSRRWLARLLRPLLVAAFRVFLNDRRSRTILQNRDDYSVLTGPGRVSEDNVRLIRSAGVDLERYKDAPLAEGPPIILLASRMLWDKGVGEFVGAAAMLRQHGFQARCVLVGSPDDDNPTAIPREQLQAWHEGGQVEWWGYRNDMPDVLAQASIVSLPSYYGEGIPKVLIEAMASSRPIVTTDMPGCRELVSEGVNGLLVPPRDVEALAHAFMQLLADEPGRRRMGQAGRQIALEAFSLPRVVTETLALYRELLDK
ncbi:MAG: glycosyltransferase family 4 protein [Pseudomonadota bacterium]